LYNIKLIFPLLFFFGVLFLNLFVIRVYLKFWRGRIDRVPWSRFVIFCTLSHQTFTENPKHISSRLRFFSLRRFTHANFSSLLFFLDFLMMQRTNYLFNYFFLSFHLLFIFYEEQFSKKSITFSSTRLSPFPMSLWIFSCYYVAHSSR
jgi:hypothetical protein